MLDLLDFEELLELLESLLESERSDPRLRYGMRSMMAAEGW